MKVWIDLDNTPHVPFFVPIIEELEKHGHHVVLTARDAFQVRQLADDMGLSYRLVGRHYGKNRLMKLVGLLTRAAELLPFYLAEKPDLAFSHGSRAQALLGNMMRIPTVLTTDYEYGRTIPLAWPKWLILPEALSEAKLPPRMKRVRYYRGLKEDVYVPRFRPDASMIERLGLDSSQTIVTVRPPASESHYHNTESDVLLAAFMSRVAETSGVRAVLLPRNEHQERSLRESYPSWFSAGKTIVPSRTVDGLNLVWLSDLVVSGGGTMNREAAALGVPVYSIFRGHIGAIDRDLERDGRIVLVKTPEEARTLIPLRPRDRTQAPDARPRPALLDIIGNLEAIIEAEKGH